MREGDGGGGNHRTSINSNMQIFSFISDEKNPEILHNNNNSRARGN